MPRSLLLVCENARAAAPVADYFGAHYLVDVASDHATALASLEQHHYEAAIVDVRLTDASSRDGLEIAQSVRSISPETSLVLLSSWVDETILQSARELDVPVVTKPASLAGIEQLLGGLLSPP